MGGYQARPRLAVFLRSAVDLVSFTRAQDQETPVSILDIAEETQVAETIAPECSQGGRSGPGPDLGGYPEEQGVYRRSQGCAWLSDGPAF